MEAQALYSILEQEAVPLFYDRGADGLPHGWIAMMKQSMRILSPVFASTRMVKEYAERYYLPASRHFASLAADNMAKAREVAAWLARVRTAWSEVRVESVDSVGPEAQCEGQGYDMRAVVHLGRLSPQDVAVEVYFGPLDPRREITAPAAVAMTVEDKQGTGKVRFRGTIPCERSGMIGYTVRVRPSHPDAPNLMATNLMTWW